MTTLNLDIVTPEKLVFSGAVTYVALAGADGDFGVLPGHAPLISTLRPGVLRVEQGAAQTLYCVSGGFAEVTAERLTVLAEEIIAQQDIDLASTQNAIAAAHAEMERMLQAGENGAKMAKLKRDLATLYVRQTLAEAQHANR